MYLNIVLFLQPEALSGKKGQTLKYVATNGNPLKVEEYLLKVSFETTRKEEEFVYPYRKIQDDHVKREPLTILIACIECTEKFVG